MTKRTTTHGPRAAGRTYALMLTSALLLVLALGGAALGQNAPTGPAGGDLAGTYPNPGLAVDRVRKTGDSMTGALDVSLPNSGGIFTPLTVTTAGNYLAGRGTAFGFNLPHVANSILGGKITAAWGSFGQSYISFGALKNNSGSSAAYGEVFVIDGRGYFGFNTSNPTSRMHVVSGTDSATSMLSLDTGVHGGTSLTVGGTAANESTLDMSVYRAGAYVSRFGVGNLGQVYLQPGGGNVGVGTNNPDTYGDGATVNYLALQAAGANQHAQIAVAGTGAGNGQVVLGNSTIRRAVISAVDGSHLLFHVNGANSGAAVFEAMRITSGGNVGVGVPAPAYKLDVNGNVNGAGLCMGGVCKTAWSQVGGQWSANSGGAGINYGGGNVGIGTPTPLAGLTGNGGMELYAASAVATFRVGTGLAGKNNAQVRFSGASGDNWAIGSDVATNSGSRDFHFYDFAGAPGARLTIQSSTGNVGIGTAAPSAKLSLTTSAVADGLLLSGGANWALLGANLGDGSYNNISRAGDRGVVYGGATAGSPGGGFVIAPWASATSGLRVDAAGNVGIGTASPASNLHVYAPASNTPVGAMSIDVGSFNTGANALNSYFFRVRDIGAASFTPFYIRGDGNVGIGTAAPQATLDVAGSINATQTINATGAITGGSIQARYQDVAEWVPSTQKLSAGTVVVLDTDKTNHVLASTKSYDTKVAGVVSAEPGVILGVGGVDKLKVATTGRVKVRVDATSAPIKVGDLLVTSGVEGVAMRSVEVDLGGVKIHRPGTIIGKALEPLASGAGEILVLLSLQ